MALTRRETTAEWYARGSEASPAVGLLSSRRRRDHVAGRMCSYCGAEARVDMVDMARTRAYLTCLSCGHEWDTDRMKVLRGSAQ